MTGKVEFLVLPHLLKRLGYSADMHPGEQIPMEVVLLLRFMGCGES